MIVFACILAYSVISSFSEAARLVPEESHTQIGSSYVLYIEEDGVTPEECYVSDIKNIYKINLNKPGLTPEPVNRMLPVLKSGNSDIITSIGDGLCGFKIDNVSKTTYMKWNLTIIDRKGQNYTRSATVVVKKAKQGREKKTAKIGDTLSIYCEDSDSINADKEYCRIYNPAGELVASDILSCSYSKHISKVSDFGIWKCQISYVTRMIPNEFLYEYVQIEKDQIYVWNNETKTHVNLGCSISNPSYPMSYCLMVRADGQTFKLEPGLATDRYTALHTNISKSICAMQIKKPLTESERNLWRCEQYFAKLKPIGGFISLADAHTRKPGAEIPSSILVHENETLNIACRAPYSSPYCYMRGPDGLIYPVENSRAISLGLCEFSKPKAKLSDNGTWFCGFGRETGTTDDVYKFQVYIPEVAMIKAEKQSVDATLGNSAELKCTTSGLGDYPLQYCRFLSPNGNMYHIGNHQFSDSISYAGRGLEYGECGIKIHNVHESDQGTWSCITRIGYNFVEKEVYINIHLSTSPPGLSVASVAGISIGVVIVLLGIVIIAVRKLKIRVFNRVRFQRNTNMRSSNSSNSSNDSSVILNVNTEATANYNATTN